MKKVLLVTLLILLPANAFAAEQFITATIADIGRPYAVIDGHCVFGKTDVLDHFKTEDVFNLSFVNGAQALVAVAKKYGGDAIVGMQAIPIPRPINNGKAGVGSYSEESGMMVCGTIVKLKP